MARGWKAPPVRARERSALTVPKAFVVHIHAVGSNEEDHRSMTYVEAVTASTDAVAIIVALCRTAVVRGSAGAKITSVEVG